MHSFFRVRQRVGAALGAGCVLICLLVCATDAAHAQDPIRLRTTVGDIFVTLAPDAAPRTVANFLDYLNNGDYRGTFFHRSLPGGEGSPQLIAAGKFSWPEGSPDGVTEVRVGVPVANEFNQSNRRGTIAMVLPQGDPDGATNAWFINVADNGAEDSGALDTIDGGATVFGTINPAGMEVVDRIAAECVDDLGGDLNEIPILGDAVGGLQREQLFLISETTEFTVVRPPVSAILPGSRSISVDEIATAFATIINPTDEVAASCRIKPITEVPAEFEYFQTDPATNRTIGNANPEIDIAANGFASFVFSFKPINPFPGTLIEFDFSCGNSSSGASGILGVNTFELAASSVPGADVIAIVATLANNGIVDIPVNTGTGAFAIATTNVGLTEVVEVTADTGEASLPVSTLVCQTDPLIGTCLEPPVPSLSLEMAEDATATFAVFVQLTERGAEIPFDPATNRVFVRFKNLSGELRGATNVAVRTVLP